jgi:hypothetical protein
MAYLLEHITHERMALARVLQLRYVSVVDLDRLAQVLIENDRVDHGIWIIAILEK